MTDSLVCPPEDGNLVAETYVGVAKYTLLIITVNWLV
jgi:hypothetical protein